jgi:hypothetical protein
LARFQVCSTVAVKELTVQNEEIKRTASAPR